MNALLTSSPRAPSCQRLGGRVQPPILLVPRIEEAPLSAVPRATVAATTAGFSASSWRNSTEGVDLASVPHQKPSDFARPLLGCPDRVLPLNAASIDVFRAAVVSIVLTVTLGQNALLLCRIWCHPAADAASASCEHENVSTSPGVTGSDRCAQPSAGATALVREDLRRGGSATDADHSVVAAQFRLAPPPTPSASGHGPGRHAFPDTRPLVLALRI